MPTLKTGSTLNKQWERIKNKLLDDFQNTLDYAGLECEDILREAIMAHAPTTRIRENLESSHTMQDSTIETRYSKIGRRTGYSKYKLVMNVKAFVRTRKAPEAFAYEYGSGLDATRGEKDFITIFPKRAPALSFLWYKNPIGRNRGRNSYGFFRMRKTAHHGVTMVFVDRSKVNPEAVSLPYVNHPGVVAKPYIRIGLKEAKDGMLQVIKEMTGAK